MEIDKIIGKKNSKKLNSKSNKIFKVIGSRWPINPVEVADILKDNGKAKTLSAKYLYHFKKLEDNGLIRLKKIGNTYVAWPMEIERLRLMHEMMRGFE